jgi:predicted negative regulator of RcsB-dependent stress response
MARTANDPLLRVAGHHAVGYTHFYRAEYEGALQHAGDGLGLFSLEQEKQLVAAFQFSSSCAMWSYRAAAQQALGMTREASESLGALRVLVEQLRHAPSTAYALAMQCFIFHAQDDVAEVHRLASETRALSLSEGFELWNAVADVFLAWANARGGANADVAVSRVKAAKSSYDSTLTHVTELELTGVVAETLLLADRADEVVPLVEAAFRISRPGRLGHYESELLRIEGDAAKSLGDSDRATERYRSAVEVARRAGATAFEARARASLDATSIADALALLRLQI